ncbi:MAG: hypothetical protein H6618_07310 [Deltaproteobacteria bacterium]|nr:hypothetical protein [Deltaproteobacteria bacterium]
MKAEETGDDLFIWSYHRHSRKWFSASFGPVWTSGLELSTYQYGASVSRHYEMSGCKELRIRGGTAFSGSGDARYLGGSLGGALLLGQEDIAPVLGAEFGGAMVYSKRMRSSKKTMSGFILAGFAGVRFFRSSDNQLELALRYELMLPESHSALSSYCWLQLGMLF